MVVYCTVTILIGIKTYNFLSIPKTPLRIALWNRHRPSCHIISSYYLRQFEIDIMKRTAGNTNAGKTNAEKTNAEKTNAEKTNAEETNAEKTNAEKTNAEKTNAEKTNTEKTNAEKTNAEITIIVKKQQNKVKDGARESAEEPYSVPLNGRNVGNVSKAPPWPTPQLKNEKMFLLPKQLESRDRITVNCETMNQPGILRFGLVTGFNTPDYSNLACQLEMFFPPQYSDKLAITTVQNGESTLVYEEDSAANYYEGTNFSMTFRMRDNGWMDIRIGESHLTTMELRHDIQNIRFLTVNGDLNKVLGLDFQFG